MSDLKIASDEEVCSAEMLEHLAVAGEQFSAYIRTTIVTLSRRWADSKDRVSAAEFELLSILQHVILMPLDAAAQTILGLTTKLAALNSVLPNPKETPNESQEEEVKEINEEDSLPDCLDDPDDY